jgi:hypothetical protein
MSISKCVVRLKDSHDTVHEAVVYAESLYEAVLRGLNRLVDAVPYPRSQPHVDRKLSAIEAIERK